LRSAFSNAFIFVHPPGERFNSCHFPSSQFREQFAVAMARRATLAVVMFP
jgi:hypothetical protein